MASQENQTPDAAAEQKKKVTLGVLAVLLLFVFWWQDPLGLFTSADATPATNVAAKPRTSPTPKASPTPARRAIDEVVSDPLHPEVASYKNTPLDGIGRNIFVYPTPTPPPPPKPQPTAPPPPPPPITLVGINPQGVIGRTPGEQTLAVTGMATDGNKMPGDMRIFLDGRELPTKMLDDSHFTAMLTPELIRNPGRLGVQVRSASDPKMFSNSATLEVAEPPAPPYKFVGLIVSKNGTTAVLKEQGGNEEVFNTSKGKVINKRWEVMNINSARIELLDVTLKIPHNIAFTGESEK